MNLTRKFWLELGLLVAVVMARGAPPVVEPKSMRPTLACDESHTLLLKSDGTVLAWGGNAHGQLGDGTENDAATPVPVVGLTDVVAVAANHHCSMALRRDGTVWTWGNNEWGQLGDGTYNSRSTPAPVAGLGDVVAISAGTMHALALKKDGTVWAWGSNDHARLGDDTQEDHVTPQKVPGLGEVIAIAAGELSNVALKNDGAIWHWGFVANAAPGDSTATEAAGAEGARKTPARAARGKSGHASIREAGHRLRAMRPSQIFRLEGATAAAVGLHHVLILKNDGSVWAMVENDFGPVGEREGDGGSVSARALFAPVRGVTDVMAVAARQDDLVALRSDGTVWQWGESIGLSAISGGFESVNPVHVPGVAGAVAVATGGNHDCAVCADGTLVSWGAGHAGQGESPDAPTTIAGGECHRLVLRGGVYAPENAAVTGPTAGSVPLGAPPASDVGLTPARAGPQRP